MEAHFARLGRLGHHLPQDFGDGFDLVVVEIHGLGQLGNLLSQLAGVASSRRRLTNARMMATLTIAAFSDFKTLLSMAMPCSVNTQGGDRRPPQLEITICDFKLAASCGAS